MTDHSIFSFLSIASVLAVSFFWIRRGTYRRALSIFVILFLIEQVAGYGLGIDLLKVNMPYGASGTRYSPASVVIPLILAFGVDRAVRLFQPSHGRQASS
ncbi:MAG: hypothetical protein ACOX9A_07370 [Anaerolineae bacterium]|jgi:hypothetical protein